MFVFVLSLLFVLLSVLLFVFVELLFRSFGRKSLNAIVVRVAVSS